MASSFSIAPSVRFVWIDASDTPATIETSTGAMVFASPRGPTTPQYTVDIDSWRSKYGNTTYPVSYASDAARAFHREARGMWNLRVVGAGAKYSAGLIANNLKFDGVSYSGTSVTPLEGTTEDFQTFNRAIKDITFDTEFGTGHSVTIDLNGTSLPAINFTISHENTMRLIASAIKTQLDVIGDGGSATVIYPEDGSTPLTIRVVSPETVTSLAITLTMAGTTPPQGVVRDTQWLYVVLSENQGEWSSGNVGVRIAAVDQGTSQRVKISFNGPLDPSNSVFMRINNTDIGPEAYDTNNNTTLQNVADAINLVLGTQMTASVVAVSGTDANREILLVGKTAFDNIQVNEASVSGSNAPTVLVNTVVNAVVPEASFQLNVYEGSDTRNAKSTYTGTLNSTVDGFQQETSIAYQVNEGPNRSDLIRLYANPLLETSNWLVQGTTSIEYSTKRGYINGGEDGAAVTTSDILNGWSVFEDATAYSIRILINAGYATVEVHKAITELCELRHDCVGILDAPSDKQIAQDLVAWRRNEQGIDSSYVGLYTCDILIYDTDLGRRRYTPPSGYVAQRFAYTDRNRREWFAAAGLNRGVISDALDLRVKYKEGDQDLLQRSQINPIIDKGGRKVIWGEMSLQMKSSYLQSLPVRRLCNTIEILAVDSVAYSLFEPNDDFTLREIKRRIDDLMEPIKNGRGVARYFTLCDRTNNPPSVRDAREANATIYFEPIAPLLRITITGVITKASSNFSELIQQGVGVPVSSTGL